METPILRPKTKGQLSALKAVAKALHVDFQTEKSLIILNLSKRFWTDGEAVKNGKAVKIVVEDLESVQIYIEKNRHASFMPINLVFQI